MTRKLKSQNQESHQNNRLMNYISFFETIEKNYFNNNFKEVINLYEKNSNQFTIDYSKEYDDKILEAVTVSYNKTDQFEKSIELNEKQIELLHKLKIPKWEKEKELKYYFIGKMNSQMELKKLIPYYKTLSNYEALWNNKQFESYAKDIEKLYYKKLLKLNKISLYVLIVIFIANFILIRLNYQFETTALVIYDIVTILWLVWLVTFWALPNKSRKWFLNIFRYIYKRKSYHINLNNYI